MSSIAPVSPRSLRLTDTTQRHEVMRTISSLRFHGESDDEIAQAMKLGSAKEVQDIFNVGGRTTVQRLEDLRNHALVSIPRLLDRKETKKRKKADEQLKAAQDANRRQALIDRLKNGGSSMPSDPVPGTGVHSSKEKHEPTYGPRCTDKQAAEMLDIMEKLRDPKHYDYSLKHFVQIPNFYTDIATVSGMFTKLRKKLTLPRLTFLRALRQHEKEIQLDLRAAFTSPNHAEYVQEKLNGSATEAENFTAPPRAEAKPDITSPLTVSFIQPASLDTIPLTDRASYYQALDTAVANLHTIADLFAVFLRDPACPSVVKKAASESSSGLQLIFNAVETTT